MFRGQRFDVIWLNDEYASSLPKETLEREQHVHGAFRNTDGRDDAVV